MTEKLYDNCVMGNKKKVSVYDFLVHDENIKRFIEKNVKYLIKFLVSKSNQRGTSSAKTCHTKAYRISI